MPLISNRWFWARFGVSHDQARSIRILLPAFPWAFKSMALEEAIQENRNLVLRGAEFREEGPGSIPMTGPAPAEFSLTASLSLSGYNEPVKFPWGRCISFLSAVVISCHKFDGFKQQEFILLWFWRLEVSNQGVSRSTRPSKALGEIFPCLFQLLVAPGIPWLVVTSL